MSERDRAAVDVDALHRQFELAYAGERLRSERFVQFDEIDVVDAPAGASERFLRRGYRTESHAVGIHARDGGRHDARERAQAATFRFLRRHEHDTGRAVVDAARVAGRHCAAFAKCGLEFGQLLHRGLWTRMLVFEKHFWFCLRLAVARQRHADQLRAERSGALRGAGLMLAHKSELVLLLPADAIALSDVL